ncbi:MAG: response regulator [Fusobacteria bacterium]|nr:response regulator [Fusobacteriota bacterium]
MKKETLVIIDDTKENLDLLAELFKNDYNLRLFPSGELALKSIKSIIPDLILLDINMPGLNGYEVCEQLKKNEITEKIPVIFLSALNDKFDKVKAFEVGGVDYVTKPFHFEELNSRVRTHIKIKKLQNEIEYKNQNLEKIVEEKVTEIKNSQLATIITITKLSEARDDDTGRHIERLSTFSKMIAQNLYERGIYKEIIDDEFIDIIYHASPLHDIGKIGIRDNILLKPGKLTNEEFEIMKTHVTLGAETLLTIKKQYPYNKILNMGLKIAKYHHEKWDGSGYCEGLKGDEIPLCARILALCDVYDALRSKRVYKEAFSHEKSYDIILEGKGKHFDPNIVDSFVILAEEFRKIRDNME